MQCVYFQCAGVKWLRSRRHLYFREVTFSGSLLTHTFSWWHCHRIPVPSPFSLLTHSQIQWCSISLHSWYCFSWYSLILLCSDCIVQWWPMGWLCLSDDSVFFWPETLMHSTDSGPVTIWQYYKWNTNTISGKTYLFIVDCCDIILLSEPYDSL